MSGTGNLLLKRKVGGDSTEGIPAIGLAQAMPVLHLGGLARADADGVPLENYSNRLWVGMSAYGGGIGDNESGTQIDLLGDTTNYSATRPIWMGAEIRAHTAVANGVLKADWAQPSDYIVATQKSIYQWATATFGGEGAAASDVAITATDSANLHYIPFVANTSGQQEFYVDPTTTPLTYTPFTSTLTASTFVGALTGTASTATTLATGRTISLTGDITGTSGTFNGSANLSFAATIAAGVIVNDDINASAAIVDTKLATINTAGKVSNTATTATTAATANTIALRDSSNKLTATEFIGPATQVNVTSTTSGDANATFNLLFNTGTATVGTVGYDGVATNKLRYNPNTQTLIVKNIIAESEDIQSKTTSSIDSPVQTLNVDLAKYSDKALATSATEPADNGRYILNRGSLADSEVRWNETSHKHESSRLIEYTTITNITPSATGFTCNFTQADSLQPFDVGEYVSISGISVPTYKRYNNTWRVASATAGSFTVVERIVNHTTITTALTTPAAGRTQFIVSHDFTIPLLVTGTSQTITIVGNGDNNLNNAYSGAVVTGSTTTTTTFNVATASYTSVGDITSASSAEEGVARMVSTCANAESITPITTSGNLTGMKITGVNFYPMLLADGKSAGGSDIAFGTTQPTQFVHSLNVKNLIMSGTWQLNAGIQFATDLDLRRGGMCLPYLNDNADSNSFHDLTAGTGTGGAANSIVGFKEGQIAYDVSTNSIVYARGVVAGNTAEVTTPSTTKATLMDLESVQTVSGAKTFSAALSASSTLGVTGATTLGGTLAVAGTTTLSGNTSVAAGITFTVGTGATTLGGTLAVTGTTTLSGNTSVSGTNTFTVGTGATALGGTLTVANTTTLSGSLNRNTTEISGITAAIISGNNFGQGVGSNFMTMLPATLTTNAAANTTHGTWYAYSIGSPTYASSNATNTITDAGTLYLAEPTDGGNITITNKYSLIAAGSLKTMKSIVFEGPDVDTLDITLSASTATATSKTHTLPNWTGTIVSPSGTGTTGYLITSTGSTQPSWTDPDSVIVGGVFFRNETTGTASTRYPIAFLGAAKSDNSATFSSLTEDNKTTGYIKTDWSVTAPSGSGSVTNASSGLMYEVGDGGPGTLYCDYIGATLDCGTYA